MGANFIKRLGAYFFDYILISLVFSLITVGFSVSDSSKKISELTNEVNSGKITYQEYYDQYQELYYESQKDNIVINVLSIILIIAYYIIFQFLNHGQTIGKKLMQIRVVSKENNEVTFKQLLIRSLFIYFIISSLLNVLIVNFVDVVSFNIVVSGISVLEFLFVIISVIFILYSKEKRGLHDLIAGTKVVYEKEVK